jgi:hypothetical protein
MTCRVIKPFVAHAAMEENSPRLFEPGDILDNVDYASGEVALFGLSGDAGGTLYQMELE